MLNNRGSDRCGNQASGNSKSKPEPKHGLTNSSGEFKECTKYRHGIEAVRHCLK